MHGFLNVKFERKNVIDGNILAEGSRGTVTETYLSTTFRTTEPKYFT